MAKKHDDAEYRDRAIVVKYGFIGVAASVAAVVLASPAGLGGAVGISTASGFGNNAAAEADNPYARLAPFPAPVSQAELVEIRASLAETAAAIEATRSASDESIARLRAIAMSGDGVIPVPNED